MADEYSKELCVTKHSTIKDRLDHHHKWLADHEEKIDRLDRSDAVNTKAIGDLCHQIGSQTKAIWGLVTSVGMALLGFFIWAVQSGLLRGIK